ncbi:MAG: hypothetical protein HY744_27245, partial [Deltaproteobacteria bacterium]|nr:hypothetical protein [Deltaproteobacteria bacterium]
AAHELRGTVAFVREASLAAEPGKPPGFGVKLAALSSAARQQIAAYVAERAPGQG